LSDGPIILSTLSEEVYKRIRQSLFQNVYRPGEQLDIGKIARNLNVSRQPVKEAINHLAQEGLLEIRPRVGTFVRKITQTDVRNIFEARRMIEIFALRNGTIDQESLQEIEKINDLMDRLSENASFDYLAYNEADHTFHKLLVGLSRNDILINTFVQLNTHYVTARAFYENAFEIMLSRHDQHREILKQLKLGKIDRAIAELDNHIRNAERELLKIFSD